MKRITKIIVGIITFVACSAIVYTFIYRPGYTIHDATGGSSGSVEHIASPRTIRELQDIVQNAAGQVAIAGARYSQGGQTWINGGTVIDMSHLNRITNIDIEHKTITVETGISWRHIQEALNPIGLSPTVMQSYNDFTVGGALSVNAHGRDTTGSIIKTVQEVKVLLHDGYIVSASRTHNADLFSAVIGGYGACGIIVEATLTLSENVAIRRRIQSMKFDDYMQHLQENVIGNDEIVLHNANVYPKSFKELLAVDWVVDDPERSVRTTELIRPESPHLVDTFGELFIRRFWGGKYLRQKLEQVITAAPKTTHRNHELGRPVATLGPWTQILSSNILQEYFIPLDDVPTFINKLRNIQNTYDINILNASIRYVPADTESILTYAPKDCCSIVLYINLLKLPWSQNRARIWTRELINAALACNGTYYLPYHIFASQDQFQQAYPHWNELLTAKLQYDPNNVFSNSLIDAYFTPYIAGDAKSA